MNQYTFIVSCQHADIHMEGRLRLCKKVIPGLCTAAIESESLD